MFAMCCAAEKGAKKGAGKEDDGRRKTCLSWPYAGGARRRPARYEACMNHDPFHLPFALSLSKGFDKLSPNGVLA
jgi:hypothetical protein